MESLSFQKNGESRLYLPLLAQTVDTDGDALQVREER